MKIRAFTGVDGLFYCVTTKGTRVHGPFITQAEVRAAAPLIRDHERSCVVADRALRPQPLGDHDIREDVE